MKNNIDLYASDSVETTISNVEKESLNWVKEASAKTNAAKGKDYLGLNRGVLTVDHLNHFIKAIPVEMAFYDANQQFLYYNYKNEIDDMLNPKVYSSVGDSMANIFPEEFHQELKDMISQMKNKELTHKQFHIPSDNPNEWIVHNFQAAYDENGEYIGVIEYTHNILPYINQILETSGKKLVKDENADASIPPAKGQYSASKE